MQINFFGLELPRTNCTQNCHQVSFATHPVRANFFTNWLRFFEVAQTEVSSFHASGGCLSLAEAYNINFSFMERRLGFVFKCLLRLHNVILVLMSHGIYKYTI